MGSRWSGSASTTSTYSPGGARCGTGRSCSRRRNSARTFRRPGAIGSRSTPGVFGLGRSPWFFFGRTVREGKGRRNTAMKRWSLVSLAAVLAAFGQKIETQKPDRTRITRVETALNHLTVIEVGDPVEQVATGSATYKVEWRGNKVFVQPLEPDAETNLFIWTRSGTRLSYELAAAGAVEKMHFAIDQEPVVTATAPLGPVPRAAAENPAIPSEMLYKSVPVQFAGAPGGKPNVAVEVRDLYEKDGKVYLRYAIR